MNAKAVSLQENETSVMDILSKEIMAISSEIENLPAAGDGAFTNEQMMRMQQIDFCSQRLAAIADLVSHLSKLETLSSDNLKGEVRNLAKLEHIQKLFD